MTHDYARKKPAAKKSSGNAQRVKKSSPSTNRGPSKMTCFMLGVAATIAVQVAFHWIKSTPQVEEVVAQAKQAVATEPKKPAKPDITFYKTLPNMDVKVNVETVKDREQEKYNSALQAGSFRNKDDANQMRAEIILMGLDAIVESRSNDQGNVWHRVIVGPFTSRSALNKARNQLANNGMQALVIKRD